MFISTTAPRVLHQQSIKYGQLLCRRQAVIEYAYIVHTVCVCVCVCVYVCVCVCVCVCIMGICRKTQ